MRLIHGITLDNLRGDFHGGLTAAVVALPLALAFGVASGAGPVAGLYGAILVGFFAALFGGTPAQVSGPTGPMTVVMAAVIMRFAHEPAMAFTVVMLGGVFQILFGLLKFGRYINLVPYPVISGFMSGIGCIIIILQLGPFFGHIAAGSPLKSLLALPTQLADPRMHPLLLGILSLAIVWFIPKRISHHVPGPLLALIAGTILGVVLLRDASVIGEIPHGLPSLQAPTFSIDDFPAMMHAALVLAFLGSVDSLLTSLIADSMTRTHHDSDRELIGQGIGNLAAGLFGGIPGAGATMRTVINVRSGGRTPISGATHALVLLAIVLGLGTMAEHIPHAVLAGILLKVGIDIIDWSYLRRLRHTPPSDTLIMLATLVLTVVVDLITAVAIGTVMASLLFVKRMADIQAASMKLVGAAGEWHELSGEEATILERAGGRILLFHIEGPMSYGTAKDVLRLVTADREQDALIIDFSDVPFIDSTAALAIEEVILKANEDDDYVILCGMRGAVEKVLGKIGVTKLVPQNRIIQNRLQSLRHAEQLLAGKSSP